MNGNDRFLNVNDAHLRVTGGNVHASSFNLDQISITTTSTTASTIDFLNEAKAFNARSNIEVGTANLFVDTTTSNVGIRTSLPEYALDVHGPANVSVLTAASNVGILTTSPEYALDVHGTANVGVLTANTITGSGGTLLLGSHLIPTQHQQFDIGSAEYKIRHLYLSNNSLWIGDDSKISVVDGKMKFLKRNKNVVPSGTLALEGNATDALAHAKISNPDLTNINQMKLEHWLAYTRSLTGGADKDIKDIFTDATANYEATSASDAFKEHGNDIYSVNKLRLGSAAAADATLDVVGTIKATSHLTVNTNTFHVDATNSRVGVGTTSPMTKLDIAYNAAAPAIVFSDTTNSRYQTGIGSLNVSNEGQRLDFYTGDSSTNGTLLTNTPRMCITGTGNVGVGTTSPGQKLSIYTGSTSTVALSFDRYSTDNYRTDIYQNSYGPDFRVGYGSHEPESILYLKRFSDGSKETEISGNQLLRHSTYNGRGYVELKFNNNGPNQGSGAGLILASDEAGAFQPLAILDTWKSGVSAAPNMVFRTQGTERMRLKDNGNFGIGTNDPSFPLQVIGKHGFDESGYWARYRVGTGHEQGTTRIYFRDFSDTNNVNLIVDNLSSNNDASDDRIKTDEVLVENATQTLLKLKPQTYTKDIFEFDELTSEEYSNTETLTDGYVFSPTHDRWRKRRFAGRPRKETGLIIQDIWYDAPELRHIIRLADDAEPTEERPETEDIQQDPDYDSLGWGQDASHLMYQQIIPYLIKSNQELHARIQALENAS